MRDMKWAVTGCFGVAVAVTLLVAGCGSSPSTTGRRAAATPPAKARIKTGGSCGAQRANQNAAAPAFRSAEAESGVCAIPALHRQARRQADRDEARRENRRAVRRP